MRRWLFLLLMVVGCQLAVYAEEEILVVVTQVRNDEGNILVMIQTDENENRSMDYQKPKGEQYR